MGIWCLPRVDVAKVLLSTLQHTVPRCRTLSDDRNARDCCVCLYSLGMPGGWRVFSMTSASRLLCSCASLLVCQGHICDLLPAFVEMLASLSSTVTFLVSAAERLRTGTYICNIWIDITADLHNSEVPSRSPRQSWRGTLRPHVSMCM